MKLLDPAHRRFASRRASPYISGSVRPPEPMSPAEPDHWHATTILTVRNRAIVAIGGDCQVIIGHILVKSNAKMVRRLGQAEVLAGFTGPTADAFTLFERLESQLEPYPGLLTRAAV